MTQRIYLVLCAACLMSIVACKENVQTSTASSRPSGKYYNSAVIKGCPGKMPYDIPSYAFELNFTGNDSVQIDNGFENYALPFVATANPGEYMILKASVAGDMHFIMTSDSTLELMDTAWTKLASASSFALLPKDGEKANWGFREYLNDCLVTGSYSLFTDGELAPHTADFMVNGQINGMKPFIGYRVCYAGDCVGETEPPSRTIDLLDQSGAVTTFAFKNIEGKMALELYEIGESQPDVKGERPIGKMKYELRTE